jgi:hypothetical protein
LFLETDPVLRYDDAAARTEDYLVWPDARLRAYLRESGISEDALPTSRPGLLRTFPSTSCNFHLFNLALVEETRIRWVQTQHSTEALYNRIASLLNSGIEIAEDRLHQIIAILSGNADRARSKSEDSARWANEKSKQGAGWASEKSNEGSEWVKAKADKAAKMEL